MWKHYFETSTTLASIALFLSPIENGMSIDWRWFSSWSEKEKHPNRFYLVESESYFVKRLTSKLWKNFSVNWDLIENLHKNLPLKFLI